MPSRAHLALPLALALAAAPVQASTLPPLDFTAGQTMVAAGVPDLNVDHALSDRMAVGLTVLHVPPVVQWNPAYVSADGTAVPATYTQWLAAGPRVTWRFMGEADGAALGVSVGGGIMGPQYTWWAQPALVGSLPIFGVAKLRASVGPVFMPNFTVNPAAYAFWPNVELAVPMARHHELTLGGNALVGWRGRF